MIPSIPVLVSTTDQVVRRLTNVLHEYIKIYTRLTVPEIIDKVGNDIRIKSYMAFREFSFGGGRRKGTRNRIAFRELAARASRGIGTLVRSRELNPEWGPFPEEDRNGRKLSLWQKLVWQETEKRQAGAGVLAVGFIDKRFRSEKPRVEAYKAERASPSLGPLVRIEKDDTSYTIEGFTPGLGLLADRYSLHNQALIEATNNIQEYLDRKLGEAKDKAMFGAVQT